MPIPYLAPSKLEFIFGVLCWNCYLSQVVSITLFYFVYRERGLISEIRCFSLFLNL